MEKDTVLRARALIGDRTPLRIDCGKLCGAACCQPDEDGQAVTVYARPFAMA